MSITQLLVKNLYSGKKTKNKRRSDLYLAGLITALKASFFPNSKETGEIVLPYCKEHFSLDYSFFHIQDGKNILMCYSSYWQMNHCLLYYVVIISGGWD